jgi:hypothetical protein
MRTDVTLRIYFVEMFKKWQHPSPSCEFQFLYNFIIINIFLFYMMYVKTGAYNYTFIQVSGSVSFTHASTDVELQRHFQTW